MKPNDHHAPTTRYQVPPADLSKLRRWRAHDRLLAAPPVGFSRLSLPADRAAHGLGWAAIVAFAVALAGGVALWVAP